MNTIGALSVVRTTTSRPQSSAVRRRWEHVKLSDDGGVPDRAQER